MCRYFPTDPGNVGADCPVENENDDSEGEGDDEISDDDGDFTDTNPLEIYQKDDQSIMEVTRPITDGEETEHIYSEVSVRASPKTGREYKV